MTQLPISFDGEAPAPLPLPAGDDRADAAPAGDRTPVPSRPGQMRLARIQLHNWGTFDQSHELTVPRAGLLLTGESGSGKSSVLDAISAVLMRPGETRFNAAAQDGPAGDRDRTPMSYVRGAYRKETDDETGEVRPGFLRTSTTVSGIALTFDDAQGKVVTAVRVMHVAGRSAAAGDLRSAFVLVERSLDLRDVLKLSTSGINRQRMKRALAPVAAAEESYPKFGVALRRATRIGSESAQRLLHRTQSAKSLTSLDDLLRGFMLEEPGTFAIADQAVDHFKALQEAHATVVDAREQVEVLTPQRAQWEAFRRAGTTRDQILRLQDSVSVFRYTQLAELSKRDLDRARVEVEVASHHRDRASRAEDDARDAVEAAQQALDARGGAALAGLDREITDAEDRLEVVAGEVARLRPVLERLGSPVPASAEEFAAAQSQARREVDRVGAEKEQLRADSGPQHVAHRDAAEHITALTEEIRSLRQRRSNLPSHLVAVRDELADAASASPWELPFAGELMDVQDASWQGAVERLLHSFSMTILVPERLYPEVSQAVEGRHWGARVSYERVREASDDSVDAPTEHTVLSVLQLADSPFRAWLRRRILRGYQHVLVDDARELPRHQRALSRAGQIKNRDHHVKDDRFRIEDRSRWYIGTDNAARLELLAAQLREAQQELARRESALAALGRQEQTLDARRRDLDRLLEKSWDELDRGDVEQRLGRLRSQRDTLLASSDIAQLEAAHRAAREELEQARQAHDQARDAHRDLLKLADDAGADLGRAQEELGGTTLDSEHREQLEQRIHRRRRSLNRQNLSDAVMELNSELNTDLNKAEEALRASESALATARAAYLRRWAERSTNLVDDIEATEDFLAILTRLEADRLPDFEHKFRDLLRTQSQNNIGQLRAVISQAIRDVHQRLEPVNESLRATPFDTERMTWLRLVAQQRHTQEVKDFLAELLAITEGAFHQDQETFAQAEARFASMDALLQRLGSAETTDLSWRRRVLDTRRHVDFVAHELDEADEIADIYSGSGGRSGGQRQRLVTFCLAASLRYQLTDRADGDPPYGLVVLDEAFDKTDIHYTRAGLEVFHSFGFQLLLATPLKMLQTIEQYVGGAAVVSNPRGDGSQLSAATFLEDEPARSSVVRS